MWSDKITKPIIALAPLADYTDSPFCHICRQVGGQDFVIFREMVSSEAIVRGNAKTLKMCEFDAMERPLVLQIFGSEPSIMARAAKIIVDKFKPDGLDINMGCPVPKVTRKVNAGASLMKDQARAVAIVKAIKEMNLTVPLSVKIRLGWAKEDEILALAPKLAQAGVDLLTIHGRTKMQGYSGSANWEMIKKVKQLVSIPIIANGDINSSEDIIRCLKITKADGVMIGRGALGNPWIFKTAVGTRLAAGVNREERTTIILQHAKLHLEHYGDNGLVTFRKHLAWYFKGGRMPEVKNIKQLRANLVRVKTVTELKDVLGSFRK